MAEKRGVRELVTNLHKEFTYPPEIRLNNVILYHRKVILGHAAMNAAILTMFDNIITLSVALFTEILLQQEKAFTYSLLQHTLFDYNKMS